TAACCCQWCVRPLPIRRRPFCGLREQKTAWAERKALKEKLLAIDEHDLRRALAATRLKIRGDDQIILDWIGYDDKERLGHDELRRVLVALVERVELLGSKSRETSPL
ncbi:MAG TPA: hypothetical protein VML57_10400, partial [Burkholderiales bacterium]|nr:hypothetical protein [Burkholderiales bacterium]